MNKIIELAVAVAGSQKRGFFIGENKRMAKNKVF